MKLIKLDKRMKGYGEFQHYAEYSFSQSFKFIEARNWCWQQWGSSCEYEFWRKHKINEHWAWITDDYRVRIYLKDEAEAQWFLLKFGNEL